MSTLTPTRRDLVRKDRQDRREQVRESRDDRRKAIAAAARALLVEKGFEGLRTRDIADRVGINVATLHYHVPTKDALVELVAESACAEFAAQGRAHYQAQATPAERLHAEFVEFIDTLEHHGELMAVMAEFGQRSRRDAKVRAEFEQLRGVWLGHVVNILAQGVRDGTFRPDLDPPVGGAMIIATLTGLGGIPNVPLTLVRSICDELERSLRRPVPKS
jgi:AcrR family transcriptional regulator